MIPLAKKTRRKIFIVLVLIFLVTAPFILAKSLGYKFEQLDDIFTLVKTGGIYIHSDVVSAEIYLDGDYVENNGLLLRNSLIQGLKPEKTYHVLIKKEGMNSWEKDLVVYPGVVTEASILMLPVEIKKVAVFPFTDKNGLGTTTPQTFISIQNKIPTNAEYLGLQEMFEEKTATTTESASQITKSKLATTTASTTPIEIPEYFTRLGISDPDSLKNLIVKADQVLWLENGNVSVNWVSLNNTAPYYYCFDLTNCRTNISVDLEKEIEKFDFLMGRDDVLIVLTEDGIYAVEIDDRSTRNIQSIYLGKNLKYKINSRDQIIVLDSGVFYKLDF